MAGIVFLSVAPNSNVGNDAVHEMVASHSLVMIKIMELKNVFLFNEHIPKF